MNKSKYLSEEEKCSYFNRLVTPYTVKKGKKFAIEQYLRADGNELLDKFWNKKSSSRMAYDLYTTMLQDNIDSIVDFEFEYKLPGLRSGGKRPNMDVFIETPDEQIFIESKFTEIGDMSYKSILSRSYYASEGNMDLVKRYYNNQKLCDLVVSFINEMDVFIMKNKISNDWFYPKQETCHLIGLLFHILDVKGINNKKKKRFRFYNIFWELEGDDFSVVQKEFERKAIVLVKSLLESQGIDFDYQSFSVQDMIENKRLLSKHIRFNTQKTKGALQQYDLLTKGSSRKDMAKK